MPPQETVYLHVELHRRGDFALFFVYVLDLGLEIFTGMGTCSYRGLFVAKSNFELSAI